MRLPGLRLSTHTRPPANDQIPRCIHHVIITFHDLARAAAALESGVIIKGYRFLRRWLERKPQLTLRQVDPIIRQLTLYRDLIAEKTQENQS